MNPVELAIIFGAIAAGAFIKGATGVGLPQIAIPVIAIFLGVERAVVIIAIPNIVSNTWLMWTYRNSLRATRDLPMLLATGTVGAVIGAWMLKVADPRLIATVLAVIIAIYVGLSVSPLPVRFTPALTRVVSPPVGLAAGALQGAIGMSGPLLITYLHAFRLDKQAFVVSLATLFQVFTTVQLITLVALRLFTVDRLVESALAIVPMLAAMPLGALAARRMSRRAFDGLILTVLVASALRLLYDAYVG